MLLFRFFFVYLLLQTAPWNWFRAIPYYGELVLSPIYQAIDWAVTTSNAQLFHVRETLVQPNGSGDTSWSYAQLSCGRCSIESVPTTKDPPSGCA